MSMVSPGKLSKISSKPFHPTIGCACTSVVPVVPLRDTPSPSALEPHHAYARRPSRPTFYYGTPQAAAAVAEQSEDDDDDGDEEKNE